jgi:protein-L-isoaspartate(D-aspartate) O-methyltransferase
LQRPGAGESIRKELRTKGTGRESIPTTAEIPLSGESRYVLRFAAKAAAELGHQHVDTVHLLLGILRKEECLAARILLDHGVESEALEKVIEKHIAREGSAMRPKPSKPMSHSVRRLVRPSDSESTFGPPVGLVDLRRFYAEEIRIAASVRSPEVVDAFARVPREIFLGPAPWHIASQDQVSLTATGLAGFAYLTTDDARDLYHNVLIAIDPTRYLNNGQPSALARWIDSLDLKPGDRVFHLGCGVGYYTAIIAEVVGPAGSVVAIEADSDLAARAKKNLASYLHVTVHSGDGAELDQGICDAMLINAGVTHPHRPWLDRLAEGGRLVLPLTAAAGASSFGSGVMARIVRLKGSFSADVVSHVAIYSCTSVRDPQLELPLGKALTSKALLKLKSVRLDSHEKADTCLLHGSEMCLSSADNFGAHEAAAL